MWMAGVTAGAVCLINIITLRVGRHGHLDRNQQVRLFVDFLSSGCALWRQSVNRQNGNSFFLRPRDGGRRRGDGRRKKSTTNSFHVIFMKNPAWEISLYYVGRLTWRLARSPTLYRFFSKLSWSHLYSWWGSSKRSVGDPSNKLEFPFEYFECKYIKPIKFHGLVSQTAG